MIANYTIDNTVFDEDLVIDALRNGWGERRNKYIKIAEKKLCELTGRSKCVLFCNATGAMFAGLSYLRKKLGYDSFVCPSRTWLGTVTPAVMAGQRVHLIDTPNCLGFELDQLQQASERLKNRRSVICNVDLMGFSAQHSDIQDFVHSHMSDSVYVVDAAESLGSIVDNKPSAAFGLFSTISFNATKIVTSTIGGALLTDDDDLFEYASSFKNNFMDYSKSGKHFFSQELGTNSNYSNLLAAMLIGGLDALPQTLFKRQSLHGEYIAQFSDFSSNVLCGQQNTSPNFWQICISKECFSNFSVEQIIEKSAKLELELRPCFYDIEAQNLFPCEKVIDLKGQETEYLCLPSGDFPIHQVEAVHKILRNFTN